MNKREEIQNLKYAIQRLQDKIGILEQDIFKLQNPFKFEINEVILIKDEEKFIKGTIFNRYWENRNKLYEIKDDHLISSLGSYIDHYNEEKLLKIDKLKEEICGSKTIDRVKGKDRKKKESKSKN